jgi:hypothetical protein
LWKNGLRKPFDFFIKTTCMIFRPVMMTAALVVSFATANFAQTGQFSAAASYLKGTGDNTSDFWGGGIAGKGFIGDNFALGATIHSYPKRKFSAEVNGFKYTNTDLLTNAAATFDILLNKKTSMVQPYIGTDAGVSFNNRTVTYTSANSQIIENKNKKTFFLLSPKAGINIGLGQAFGVFGQVQYNFTFGDGKSVSISDAPNPFTTKAVTEFLTLDAGIYFRLMPAK